MHHHQDPGTSQAIVDLHDKVLASLNERFGTAVTRSHIDYDFPVFIIEKSRIHEVLSFLKNDTHQGYTFLTTMCGAHFPETGDNEFMLMYQLHNMEKNLRIRLKIFMPKKDIEVPTITDIWAAANWMEREAFDFYGFRFKGHPDLRRILNMEEMDYFPMRKEYPLEDAGRDDKQDKYFGR